MPKYDSTGRQASLAEQKILAGTWETRQKLMAFGEKGKLLRRTVGML